MKKFYRETYWFWIVSKLILILLLLISTLSILSAGRLRTAELTVNSIGLIEAIFLGITLAHDFTKANLKYLKIVTGTVLILAGIALFIVLMTVSKGSRSDFYFLGYPLAIWMILLGIFDVLGVKKSITN